jgi:hypothetical protein
LLNKVSGTVVNGRVEPEFIDEPRALFWSTGNPYNTTTQDSPNL